MYRIQLDPKLDQKVEAAVNEVKKEEAKGNKKRKLNEEEKPDKKRKNEKLEKSDKIEEKSEEQTEKSGGKRKRTRSRKK